jgi:glycosyltransferase involved in cell wall biosynthesis
VIHAARVFFCDGPARQQSLKSYTLLAVGGAVRVPSPSPPDFQRLQHVPTVSVLIVTRDRKRFLGACLASLRIQTYTDFETILVDDGSVDGTEELADGATVFVKTPPLGVGQARNTAIDLATGKYLYILDSDDLLTPEALALSVRVIERTGADLVFSDLIRLRDGLVKRILPMREQSLQEVLISKEIPHGSSLIRRSTLDVRYDESLPSAEDFDFLLRYMPGKFLRKLPRPVYYYRYHSDQESRKPIQKETADWIRAKWSARLGRDRR